MIFQIDFKLSHQILITRFFNGQKLLKFDYKKLCKIMFSELLKLLLQIKALNQMIFVLILLVDMLSFQPLRQWGMEILHMKKGCSKVH